MKRSIFSLLLLLSCSYGANADKLPPQLQESSIDRTLRNVRSHGVQFVNVTWSDILGKMKEITIPVHKLESALKNDMFFDGSSITGFTEIFESDLRLKIDTDSFSLSPWRSEGTSSSRFFCDVFDTDGNPYRNDPRSLLKKVITEAAENGYECLCGAEIEFFLFKKEGDKYLPADSGVYCGAEENAEMKFFKEALLYALVYLGVSPEKIHHEVAGGQLEVVLECCDPLTLADRIQLTKLAIKMFARQHGFIATFMPKPVEGENGTGMHIHASLKQDGNNAFFDYTKECYLSDAARSFITGILKHVPEINVLFNAEVNSSKRLVPGYEAPIFLCCGDKNRSAAIRVPEVTRENAEEHNGSAVRIELRWPDPECNPYLALAGLFKTGIEGIINQEAATPFVNKNLYHVSLEEIKARGITILPQSLKESLDLFETSSFAKKLLGESLHASYLKQKRKEWEKYLDENPQGITQWELARGL